MDSNQEKPSRWLGKKIIEAKNQYIIASILILLSAGCFVAFCWYLSVFAVSWLNKDSIVTEFLLYAIIFLTGRYFFAHFASTLNYRAGNIVIGKIKKELYPKLLNNSQSDSVTNTLLVTRVSDDLKPFYSFFIPYAIASVLVSGLIFVVCLWVEKWVAFLLLISFVIIPLQMIIIGLGAEALHNKHINLFLRYSAVFYNRLQTIAEIVNLNNFKPQYLFLKKKGEELNNATTSVMRVAILSSAVLELFVTICIAAIAIYFGMSLLGIMVGDNYGETYDFGIAMFLLTLSPYFFFYLRKFVSAYHDRNKAMASAKLIIPILSGIQSKIDIDIDEPLDRFSINNLSYAYPNSPVRVLNDINISLPTKGLVLIKGISGSGKSTLLKLCTGSLTLLNGQISVNNKNNEWTHQWLKDNSSFMNQFPFVFDGTLRYNIFLEKDLSSYTEYPSFLDKIVNKKKEKWDTLLSHNGKQLSGGEKQLITLARMLLHPKPIAILDEPTANLDTDTIEIILPQIVKLAEERLVIIASHEKMFDSIADYVLNLNWGEQMDHE